MGRGGGLAVEREMGVEEEVIEIKEEGEKGYETVEM